MVNRRLRWGAAALSAAPLIARAAEISPGPAEGSVLQVFLGLGLVLVMIAGAAWLARRLGVGTLRCEGLVTVRGGVAVGQRERVVVVEIADTWLVLGVAPGRVSTLHTLPRPQGAHALQETARRPFSHWFKRAMDRTHA